MNTDELDDEYKPTRIRIPRVDDSVYLAINKTQAYESKKSGKVNVVLKKQVVGGFTIPHGTVISVDYLQGTSSGRVLVHRDEMNKMLKIWYLDTLRTIKKEDY